MPYTFYIIHYTLNPAVGVRSLRLLHSHTWLPYITPNGVRLAHEVIHENSK